MNFTEFKQTLMQHLPAKTDLTIGEDFSQNYDLLVDKDGYIHVKKYESFLRVKTSIRIENIEFRKEVQESESEERKKTFYMIDGSDALVFDGWEGDFIFYEDGEPSGWGSAFEHFTKFPFDSKTQH